jgi:hypothetical protein
MSVQFIDSGDAAFTERGMSLRDWFAGMAMQSIQRELSFYAQKLCEEQVAKGNVDWSEIRSATEADCLAEDAEQVAFAAYEFADAMIKAKRGKL